MNAAIAATLDARRTSPPDALDVPERLVASNESDGRRPLPREPARPGLGVRALDDRSPTPAWTRWARAWAPSATPTWRSTSRARRGRDRPASTRAGGTELDISHGDWMINPGGVGQPRDGDPRAAWLLLDLENWTARAGAGWSIRSTTPRAAIQRGRAARRALATGSTTASDARAAITALCRSVAAVVAVALCRLRHQGAGIRSQARRADRACSQAAARQADDPRSCSAATPTSATEREGGRAAVDDRQRRARLALERRRQPRATCTAQLREGRRRRRPHRRPTTDTHRRHHADRRPPTPRRRRRPRPDPDDADRRPRTDAHARRRPRPPATAAPAPGERQRQRRRQRPDRQRSRRPKAARRHGRRAPMSAPSEIAGRYQLERRLGAGGMSTVFLARDSRARAPRGREAAGRAPRPTTRTSWPASAARRSPPPGSSTPTSCRSSTRARTSPRTATSSSWST